MAKKPQDGLDEEAIIRLRDGIYDPASDKPLNTQDRRVLADARLRALAFALGREKPHSAAKEKIDDTELFAYLLDSLPEPRRTALEEAIRGNADAFGRLMTLRNALSSQTDRRDRQHADDPARVIPRHTAGRVEIRRMGGILQFSDATRPRSSFILERFADAKLDLESPAVREYQPWAYRNKRRHPFQWGDAEGAVRVVLQRAERDLHTGMRLVDQTHSLLDWWWNIDVRELEENEGEAFQIRNREALQAQLTKLLHEIEIIAGRINDELSDVSSALAGLFPPISDRAMLSPDASLEEPPIAASPSPHLLRAQEIWSEVLDLAVGPRGLRLTGTAVPNPQLQIAIQPNEIGTAAGEPFLTLIRPSEGFEMVSIEPAGSGKFALPVGESILLLQADEVWEIHLSFDDRRGL